MTIETQTPTPDEIDQYIKEAHQMRAEAIAESFKAFVSLPGKLLHAVADALRVPETDRF